MSLQSDLLAIQAGYQAALVADAANPQPSATLDGKSVSREEWRQGLLDKIAQIQKTLNQLNPYVISTKVVT